jgi:hypothetical protein
VHILFTPLPLWFGKGKNERDKKKQENKTDTEGHNLLHRHVWVHLRIIQGNQNEKGE